MIGDLRSLLTKEQLRIRPNAMTAYHMLCDLAAKVRAHLAEEDKGLYPALLIHEDPKVKSIAWGFTSGEKPLRQMFDDYYKKWLKNCDFKFSSDFVRETDDIFEMVLRRVEREEQILFPKLLEIGFIDDASQPVRQSFVQ
jgi:hypothetical protein